MTDQLQAYAALLQTAHPGMFHPGMSHPGITSDGISVEESIELLLKGVVVSLEADGSPPAVEILYGTAAGHAIVGVRSLAALSLERLAATTSGPAINALYRLALETDRLAARQLIEARGWAPTRPALRALFDLLFSTNHLPSEADLALLTQGYFEEASPTLRERLIFTASEKGLENWARIITAESELSGERVPNRANAHYSALDLLVQTYPTFSEPERNLALHRLAHLAQNGDTSARETAQNTIARLFIEHEDAAALKLALEHQYYPMEPEQRALFLFLADEWEQYKVLDFDHSLLVNAYEYGSRGLRRRLLEHGRRSGYLEWLRSASSSGDIRWPADLTDADWEMAIQRLHESNRWEELWQLAQIAPPLWSAPMIDHLGQAGWLPPDEEDRPAFAALRSLARECLAAPLAIQPSKKIAAPAGLNSVAVHPQGSLLAAGSSDQRIFCWNLPDALLRHPPLSGPAQVVRAIAFNPDGSLLAAAAGDHRIRIFRMQDGAIVKTLEGHRALIRSLAIHPDGRLLASAGFDGSIRLWRFPFGPELKNIPPHIAGHEEIFNLAISPDGKHMLTAGADRSIRVWSLPDGSLLRQIRSHEDTITNLALSFENDLVASAGRDRAIRIWNFNSGRLLKKIDHLDGSITALCLHPNDQVLIAASSSKDQGPAAEIQLWNISTGKLINRLPGHSQAVTGLAITPSGETLFSCDQSGRLLSWDLRAFLTIRLAGSYLPASAPGSFPEPALQARLKDPAASAPERKWLAFTQELLRFRQRFDIQLSEFHKIQLGEFDIEL